MHLKNYLKFWSYNIFSSKRVITDQFQSIFEIDFIKLKEQGVNLIIFDYDDTLTGFHDDLTPKTKELLFNLDNQGLQVAILSNFPPHREGSLRKNLDGHNIYLEKESNKPSTKGYIKIMQKYEVSGEQTVMIGDKVGTDLWGAYLAGIKYRLLVEPYSKNNTSKKAGILFRFQRKMEKGVYFLRRRVS